MALRIQKHVIKEIVAHAEKNAPIEACGYLAGNDDLVTVGVPLCNADESPKHFSFDPKEQFEAVRDLRKRGFKPMAVYHSHPASPARPSQEDIRLAFDPNVSYVIVSLDNGVAVKSFSLQAGTITEEEITLV